jgi:hypothetical protein
MTDQHLRHWQLVPGATDLERRMTPVAEPGNQKQHMSLATQAPPLPVWEQGSLRCGTLAQPAPFWIFSSVGSRSF